MSDAVVTKREGFSFSKMQGFLLPVTAISMVFVMLIPVPSFVLDLFSWRRGVRRRSSAHRYRLCPGERPQTRLDASLPPARWYLGQPTHSG